MTTIDDLRQQLESKYLEPATEQTPSTPLAADINSTVTTFTITAGILSPDEESMIGPGALLELEYEMTTVLDYDHLTNIVTCKRGVRGTEAVAHVAANTDVRFPTRWPRRVVAESVEASIEALWQPLFVAKEIRATVDTSGYIELPLTTVRILQVQYEGGDGRWYDADAELFATHPLESSSAGLQVDQAARAASLCVVRYGVKLEAPDSYTSEIEFLPTKWERIILVDTAAELLAGVDIDAITQENLTESLRLDRFPVRSGSNISTSLIRYREYLVEQAKTELEAQYPRGIEVLPVVYVR